MTFLVVMIGIREKQREGMEKTAPCMAIAEKKGHGTGGCMNVLSQFLEWNRKFSKKRLFPKKLLLHAGEEQASKRFGKKEKRPKPVIHLISDGYYTRGSKKNEDNNRNDDANHHNLELRNLTRSPGLVARLMGLESMPSFSGQDRKLDEHVIREYNPPEDLRFSGSAEPEPEMVSDRRSVVKFGAGLHLKDVLSRPRRRQSHHPKLPPQSKRGNTFWNHNSSRTSRLVDVATRILEPGLQEKNRAKYTLTQSDAPQLPRSRLKANKTASVASDSVKRSFMGEQCIECAASASNLVSDPFLHSPERNEVKPVSTIIQNVEKNKVRTREQVSNIDKMRTVEGTLGCNSSQSKRVVSPPYRANSFSTIDEAKDPIEKRICTRQDDSPGKTQRKEGKKIQFLNGGSAGSGLKKNGNVKRVIACEEEEEEAADRKLPPRNRQPSRRNKNEDASSSVSGGRTKEKSYVSGEKCEKLYSGKQMALSGDALGALLDRTLKELTSEGEEETNGTGKSRRSTAVILQDLISALTTEQLITKKESKPDTEFTFQTQAENEESSLGLGSCTCFEADTMQPEADVQGSANSIKKSDFSDYGAVMDLTERVSRLSMKMNEAGIGLKGGELRHAQDIILNTELLFSDTTGSVPGSSLLDQLEDLGSRNWRPALCHPGSEETEETNQFNRGAFVFDSVIEFLESRYSMCGDSGARPCKNLPSHVNVESLFREQSGRWMKLAGKPADAIIEWEMANCSLGKWRDFEAEVSETGDETSSDILEGLLGELATDLVNPMEMCNVEYLPSSNQKGGRRRK
ncbi:PREDICTED: uncharacterized protein LOC104820943 isoform X2 [Tarenaya hassleriana]|uniref:uncharacterized protein LOC104820943 isoform X2 n=1 Tax=Tarenaya hassleriana TaxID=28532 RepID=UPI00053C5567|nr:PREDICTED: uncharacterized protein LOC104820943 isoform X2 [Tarenaya hassleriana]